MGALIFGQGGSGSGGSGGSNPSVGPTGAVAPSFATEIGVIDIFGNLEGVSASNPVRVDPTGTTTQPVEINDGTNVMGAMTHFGSTPGAVFALNTNSSIFAGTTALSATGTSLNVNVTGGVSGTQYTNGAAVASPIGTVALGWDGANVRALSTDTGGQLKVLVENFPATVSVTQGTSPWVVSLTSTTITGTVAVTQSTSPWVVSGTDADNATNSTAKVPVIPARANAAAPSWTENHEVPLSVDLAGNLRIIGSTTISGSVSVTQGTSPWVISGTVAQGTAAALTAGWSTVGGQTAEVTDSWTSATALNSVIALTVAGYSAVIFTLAQTGNCLAGVITFEASDTALGTNWYPILATPLSSNSTPVGTVGLGTSSTTVAYSISAAGWVQVRARLSTVIMLGGTANVGLAASADTSANPTLFISGGSITANAGNGTFNENLSQVAGVNLGATAVTNFGTAPAAVVVPGVNASIFAGTTGITATGNSLNVNITGGGSSGSTGSVTTAAATWNSSTAANTAFTVISNSFANSHVIVMIHCATANVLTGTIAFEGSFDNSTWSRVPYYLNTGGGTAPSPTEDVYAINIASGTQQPVYVNCSGYPYIRVRLATTFSGSGVLTFDYTLQTAIEPPIQTIQGSVSINAFNSPLPAGGNIIGEVEITDGTNVLGTAAQPIATRPGTPSTTNFSHAIIAISAASGAQTLIAGVGGKTIRVYKIQFTTDSATNFSFQDSTPTSLSGVYVLTGNGSSFSDWMDGEPLWIGASGKGFQLNLVSAATVGGDVWYTQS